MTRFGLIFVLFFAACADPATLRVTVLVEPPETMAVDLDVIRSGRNTPLIECRLHADGRQEGRCSFEEQQKKWAPGSPIELIVYGSKNFTIEVEAAAIDRDGAVITSTRGSASLSADGPDRNPLVLVLKKQELPAPKKRTEVHRSCSATFTGNSAQSSQTALAIVDTEIGKDVVAAVPQGFVRVNYRQSERGCLLTTSTLAPSNLCGVRNQALLVGNLTDEYPGDELLALCARPAPIHLAALVFEADGTRLREHSRYALPQGFPSASLSRPAIFDPDGDGVLEAAIVTATAANGLTLISWRPGPNNGDAERVPLAAVLSNRGNNNNVTHAPLVLPAGGAREELLIAGYRGGIARWDRRMLLEIDGNGGASLLAPAVAWIERTMPPVLVQTGPAGGSISFFRGDISVTATTAFNVAGPLEIALAVGDVHGDGTLSAVWAANRSLAIAPFPTGVPQVFRRDLGGSFGAGSMPVMLANLDGNPGSEILVHGPTEDLVQLVDALGQPLPGWPQQAGASGVPNRVAVTDLDEDGSAEIIVLHHEGLTVLSLGPDSWDPDEAPWPLPFRDRRQTSALLDRRAH